MDGGSAKGLSGTILADRHGWRECQRIVWNNPGPCAAIQCPFRDGHYSTTGYGWKKSHLIAVDKQMRTLYVSVIHGAENIRGQGPVAVGRAPGIRNSWRLRRCDLILAAAKILSETGKIFDGH